MIDDYPLAHKELLEKIDNEGEFLVQYFDSKPIIHSALRAVIELHKPFQFVDGIDEYKFVCQHCQLGAVGDIYPCETIRSIAEEVE